MDSNTIQPRQNQLFTTASFQQAKSPESNEPTIETKSDNNQDDSQRIYKGTVKLSDTSLKLSTSSPVKSSDKSASIQDNDQAQQAIKQLLADFQSNPSQAHDTHSNIFAGAVKTLLG